MIRAVVSNILGLQVLGSGIPVCKILLVAIVSKLQNISICRICANSSCLEAGYRYIGVDDSKGVKQKYGISAYFLQAYEHLFIHMQIYLFQKNFVIKHL